MNLPQDVLKHVSIKVTNISEASGPRRADAHRSSDANELCTASNESTRSLSVVGQFTVFALAGLLCQKGSSTSLWICFSTVLCCNIWLKLNVLLFLLSERNVKRRHKELF